MFCIDGYISVMSNNFTDQHGPKPPLPGEVARRNRDGEVAANLRRPLSQPAADSSPGREPWMVHIPQAPFTQGSLGVVVGQGWENDCCFLGRDAA